MPGAPDLSVIVPTRNRADQLRQCLACLQAQPAGSPSFEVIVVSDGPDPAAARTAAAAGANFIEGPRHGNAHAKNLALSAARGEIVLFLNDDVRPEPGCIAAHARAHRERRGLAPAMVVGHSPFAAPDPRPETAFDRLARRTSIIFFYDRMIDRAGRPLAPPDHDWGYRHAWTLNLSVPRAAAVAAGGFRPAIANCCYEDVEFAWRMAEGDRSPVLFRPEALAEHHHRMIARDYLAREWRLGYSAFGFARAAPRCARHLFGRDILSADELDRARRETEAFAPAEAGRTDRFIALSEAAPPPAGTPEEADFLAEMLDFQRPLKRQAFRRGLLAAAAGEPAPGLFLPSHGLETRPGLAA